MTNLTDTQLVILTTACQRSNHLALPLPEHLRGGAAQKVVDALLAKGLLAEVAAGRSDPIWRQAGEGQRITLAATDAACAALGIEGHSAPDRATGAASAIGTHEQPSEQPEAPVARTGSTRKTREGTKQACVGAARYARTFEPWGL